MLIFFFPTILFIIVSSLVKLHNYLRRYFIFGSFRVEIISLTLEIRMNFLHFQMVVLNNLSIFKLYMLDVILHVVIQINMFLILEPVY